MPVDTLAHWLTMREKLWPGVDPLSSDRIDLMLSQLLTANAEEGASAIYGAETN